MADLFSPIEHNGGWWQLRRHYEDAERPEGFVLVVRRADGKSDEFRGHDVDTLVDRAVVWCIDGHAAPKRRRKKVKRPRDEEASG